MSVCSGGHAVGPNIQFHQLAFDSCFFEHGR